GRGVDGFRLGVDRVRVDLGAALGVLLRRLLDGAQDRADGAGDAQRAARRETRVEAAAGEERELPPRKPRCSGAKALKDREHDAPDDEQADQVEEADDDRHDEPRRKILLDRPHHVEGADQEKEERRAEESRDGAPGSVGTGGGGLHALSVFRGPLAEGLGGAPAARIAETPIVKRKSPASAKTAPKTYGMIWPGFFRGTRIRTAVPAPVKGMLIASGAIPAAYLEKSALGSPRSERSVRSRKICLSAPLDATGDGVLGVE